MVATELLLNNTDFLLEPMQHVSNFIFKQKASHDLFNQILGLLLDFFEDKKSPRNHEMVNNAFKHVDSKLKLGAKTILITEDLIEEVNFFKKEFESFVDENASKIELIFHATEGRHFILRWILAFEESMKIITSFIEQIIRKKQLLKKPGTTRETFLSLIEVAFNSFFLVQLRIIEQIFLITKNKPHDLENEKDYLIKDVVYLRNVTNTVSYELKKLKSH